MAALTLAMSYSMNHKLATAGDEALQMYRWAKRHVKQPDGGGARIYVDDMQRVVERTMNRRNPQKPASTPPSTPPANTPPSTQGFLAPSLAKARIEPDDDEVLDLVREVAKDSGK